jgi:hypothetical protein
MHPAICCLVADTVAYRALSLGASWCVISPVRGGEEWTQHHNTYNSFLCYALEAGLGFSPNTPTLPNLDTRALSAPKGLSEPGNKLLETFPMEFEAVKERKLCSGAASKTNHLQKQNWSQKQQHYSIKPSDFRILIPENGVPVAVQSTVLLSWTVKMLCAAWLRYLNTSVTTLALTNTDVLRLRTDRGAEAELSRLPWQNDCLKDSIGGAIGRPWAALGRVMQLVLMAVSTAPIAAEKAMVCASPNVQILCCLEFSIPQKFWICLISLRSQLPSYPPLPSYPCSI